MRPRERACSCCSCSRRWAGGAARAGPGHGQSDGRRLPRRNPGTRASPSPSARSSPWRPIRSSPSAPSRSKPQPRDRSRRRTFCLARPGRELLWVGIGMELLRSRWRAPEQPRHASDHSLPRALRPTQPRVRTTTRIPTPSQPRPARPARPRRCLLDGTVGRVLSRAGRARRAVRRDRAARAGPRDVLIVAFGVGLTLTLTDWVSSTSTRSAAGRRFGERCAGAALWRAAAAPADVVHPRFRRRADGQGRPRLGWHSVSRRAAEDLVERRRLVGKQPGRRGQRPRTQRTEAHRGRSPADGTALQVRDAASTAGRCVQTIAPARIAHGSSVTRSSIRRRRQPCASESAGDDEALGVGGRVRAAPAVVPLPRRRLVTSGDDRPYRHVSVLRSASRARATPHVSADRLAERSLR